MHLAEKFQAHGAREVVRTVQNEARRGDDAVAAFLLDAGQSGQEFVGYIFAQSGLAEFAAGNLQYLRFAVRRLAIRFKAADAEARHVHIMDLAEVVIQPFDRHPQTVRRDHLPRSQIVQRGTPQHGLLAARVHGHIAANAAGIRRSRVHREHQICWLPPLPSRAG